MCRFPLFETLAVIDGVVQNSVWHQQRLDRAMAAYFGSDKRWNLAEILQIPTAFRQGLVRCRLDYSATAYHIACYPYQARQIHTFRLVHTQQLDYRFKYADRSALDKLKSPDCDEVIIVNNGQVSDCTIGNLLFLKNGRWYSPQHFLLGGTQLAKLVAAGQVKLVEMTADDIYRYEQIMVINALNPFDPTRAVKISPESVKS